MIIFITGWLAFILGLGIGQSAECHVNAEKSKSVSCDGKETQKHHEKHHGESAP